MLASFPPVPHSTLILHPGMLQDSLSQSMLSDGESCGQCRGSQVELSTRVQLDTAQLLTARQLP